jgi:putative FmdB family regulatory protein
MPLYNYKCKSCGKIFSIVKSIKEDVEKCSNCGSDEIHRVFNTCPLIRYKGQGYTKGGTNEE